jgi:hypothetical protein
MKIIYASLLMVVFAGCKSTPFVKHDLSFEKVSDDCSAMNPGFKMNSNLNGERYEFQRCLDADFKKEQLTHERQGDTIVLKFERKNSKQALYNLTIDLDAYPRYNFLAIDGNTFPINPAGN